MTPLLGDDAGDQAVGVTSKAGLYTSTPSGAVGAPVQGAHLVPLSRSSMGMAAVGMDRSMVEQGRAT